MFLLLKPIITNKSHFRKQALVGVYSKKSLEQFEKIVAETGRRVYGRAPNVIRHMGGYKCRRIGGYPHLLSEHSFGNAIDVSRFYFPKLTGDAPEQLPKELHQRFEVRILNHWDDKHTANGLHRTFLRQLGQNLIDAKLFRVLLGPSFPNHKDHFHLDCAPYTLVSIF